VTYVLRTIAVVVAILGVSLALTILVMERTREIGILRATGASRGQIQRLHWIEAGVHRAGGQSHRDSLRVGDVLDSDPRGEPGLFRMDD